MSKELKLNQIGCNNCGAELLFDPGTQMSNCNFCGSTFEIEKAIEVGVIQPDSVLPFTVVKSQYNEKVLEWLSEGDYTPDDILGGSQFTSINGLYLPMYLYKGKYSGNWSASSGYDRTEYYTVYNESSKKMERRSRIVTDWRPSNGQVQGRYSLLGFAGGVNKINDEIVNYAHGTSFERGDIKKYNVKYTQGFSLLEYESDHLDTWDNYGQSQGELIVENDSKKRIPGDRYKDFFCDVMFDQEGEPVKVYIPFWVTYYDYNGKSFYVHMDGTSTTRINGVRPEDEERKKEVEKKFYKGHFGCLTTIILFCITAFGIESWDPLYDDMMNVIIGSTLITLVLYGIGQYQKNKIINKSKMKRQELLKQTKENQGMIENDNKN